MVNPNIHNGSRFYIGPISTPATDTSSEYAALTWVEVDGLETMPEIGDDAADVVVSLINVRRKVHMKGSRDAGAVSVAFAWDGADAGQAALKAAAQLDYTYAFKVVANDKLDANDTNSIFYFQAKVRTARRSGGGSDTAVMLNASLGIVSDIIEVPLTVVP